MQLEGKYYECSIHQGDSFQKGDCLLTFDLDGISKEGYSIETPVIITNTENYQNIEFENKKFVNAGESIIQLS